MEVAQTHSCRVSPERLLQIVTDASHHAPAAVEAAEFLVDLVRERARIIVKFVHLSADRRPEHLYLAQNNANHGPFSRCLIAVQRPRPFLPWRVGSKPMQQVPLLRSESRRLSLFPSLTKAAS